MWFFNRGRAANKSQRESTERDLFRKEVDEAGGFIKAVAAYHSNLTSTQLLAELFRDTGIITEQQYEAENNNLILLQTAMLERYQGKDVSRIIADEIKNVLASDNANEQQYKVALSIASDMYSMSDARIPKAEMASVIPKLEEKVAQFNAEEIRKEQQGLDSMRGLIDQSILDALKATPPMLPWILNPNNEDSPDDITIPRGGERYEDRHLNPVLELLQHKFPRTIDAATDNKEPKPAATTTERPSA